MILKRQKKHREPTIALINVVFLMLIFFLVAGRIAPPLDADLQLDIAGAQRVNVATFMAIETVSERICPISRMHCPFLQLSEDFIHCSGVSVDLVRSCLYVLNAATGKQEKRKQDGGRRRRVSSVYQRAPAAACSCC